MAEEKNKKRCQSWSQAEKAFALELIKSQEEIFERFQGANQGKLKKKLCWEKIALDLNAFVNFLIFAKVNVYCEIILNSYCL